MSPVDPVDPDKSVNCYFCHNLFDERECISADEYNKNDGGSICPECVETRSCEMCLRPKKKCGCDEEDV